MPKKLLQLLQELKFMLTAHLFIKEYKYCTSFIMQKKGYSGK